MKEFEKYDSMMVDYYNTTSPLILPISSLEFLLEHNWFLQNFKNDLDALDKISSKWDFENIYQRELVHNKSVIVVTDINLKIVYATGNIKRMSGYEPDEVIGNSPKMFQGKDTDSKVLSVIREALDQEKSFEVSILNYKKDNSTYICDIKGFPVHDKKGKLINYIAFEKAA